MEPLLAASGQLRRFAARDLSPVEVLEAQIERASEVEPRINAFASTHFEEALDAARLSERRWASGEARRLEGLTVAVKEEHDVAGWPLTYGSRAHAGRIARTTHPAVSRLIDAGAVVHAQTTTPELWLTFTTWSNLWGTTRHPVEASCSPGGSSGGSAAALAAGTTTLATGSDMAGSIRVPAALCGLYGYAPAFGAVPSAPEDEGLVFASDGPMATTLADVLLAYEVMSGRSIERSDGVEGWRVAVSMDLSYAPLAPEVRANTRRFLDDLARAGVEVEEADLGWDGQEIADVLWDALLVAGIGGYIDEAVATGAELSSYVRNFAERERSPDALERADALGARLRTDLDGLFGAGARALICPAVTTTEVPADLDPFGPPMIVGGRQVSAEHGWTLTPAFNLVPDLGVLSVPTGVGPNGVGTGVQLVSAEAADAFSLGGAVG